MKKPSLRLIIQISIVATVFYLGFIHQKFGIEKAAPIDAYCPFGAVESFFTLIFKGEFLKRIFSSSFILLGIFFIATILFGRVFCGYFCPLGAIQEWLRILGKKLGFKKDLEIPAKFDKYLRYLKYIVLVVIVYFSFYLGDLIFRNYDPYSSLMHFGHEFKEKIFGYTILIVILIGALFSKSFWCRYLCPLGAFFGIIKNFSFFKIKRNKKTCIDCGICDEVCPANLKIKNNDFVKSADCISCNQCTTKCPKDSLSYTIFKKPISLKKYSIFIVILVIIPLIVAPFTPFWKTKPESNIVNTKGEINTADIRGSNTLKYVIEVTKVPLSEFQEKLNLPIIVDLNLKLKEIGSKYGVKSSEGNMLETIDFRNVIDQYISKPETTPLLDCPFGQIECEFPGDCGFYTDTNQDKICDHSQ